MNPAKYKADIAGGSLKLQESRIIAGLLLSKPTPAEWKNAIEFENVLQKNSRATAKRQASLIKARLNTMSPELWEFVYDGAKPLATQSMFAAAIAHSKLLRDFLINEVRDRFKTGNLSITRSHWRAYVDVCRDRDPEMPVWAQSTIDKLGDSVMQILNEVGMLSDGQKPFLQPVHYRAEILKYLREKNFEEVLRAMQVFL